MKSRHAKERALRQDRSDLRLVEALERPELSLCGQVRIEHPVVAPHLGVERLARSQEKTHPRPRSRIGGSSAA